MNAGHYPSVIATAVCAAGLLATDGKCADIRSAPGTTVTIELVDASTGRPARNAAVRLTSDNGIRCMRAPCPTNTKWVIVAGYRTTHVDFAWARHKMPLARQP